MCTLCNIGKTLRMRALVYISIVLFLTFGCFNYLLKFTIKVAVLAGDSYFYFKFHHITNGKMLIMGFIVVEKINLGALSL